MQQLYLQVHVDSSSLEIGIQVSAGNASASRHLIIITIRQLIRRRNMSIKSLHMIIIYLLWSCAIRILFRDQDFDSH